MPTDLNPATLPSLHHRANEHPAEKLGDSQFRLFADSISNLAWIADADGWIYWYNQRWYDYTGTTPKDMEGWGWQSVHDPAILPSVMTGWQASIATGVQFEMSFPLRGADGAFHTFLTRVVPFKDEHGTVTRWFGTNTDISRETEAARALSESELRFRTATEAIDGILWTNSGGGEMQGEQPGWAEFTGQTLRQYSGFGWAQALHPDDAQPTIDAWKAAVRGRRRFVFEHRVRRRDGVFRLCSVRALPVLNDSGSIRQWVGVHTDITEDRAVRDELERTVVALKEQQELVESAQLVSNVGFWRYQPSTERITQDAGSRTLFGLPAAGPISVEQTFARFHPDDLPRVQTALRESFSSGLFQVEFRTAADAANESRWILAVARILGVETGDPYFVGMNLDVTPQKLAADALMRSEKLAVAGRLAASIAHEINNPLEAVTNLLYLIMQGNLDDDQRNLASIMQGELLRITHIATHTLRFHRQSSQASSASLTPLVESVFALHEGRMRNAGVKPRQRLRATRSVVIFDSELRQVLANLVGNAVDAMSAAPEPRGLSLRTRDATDWITGRPGIAITVADTGTGMSAQTQAHLFNAFFTTKEETGTGLGLWVSLEIVTKHGGRLRFRSSQQPGRTGTVFQLFLPSAPVAPRPA